MNHFQTYLAEEFAEDYQEGRLNRREALKLIASVTGSLLAAGTFLSACAPAEALTQSPTLEAGGATAQPIPTEMATETPMAAGATSQPATATPSPTSPAASAPSGTVTADDPAVQAGDVRLPGGDGAELQAYLARPSGDGAAPVILVCHENRGLTDHIKDVTRRLAKAGYVGLAMDLLSRQGGTAAVGADQVPGQLGNTSPDQFVADFLSGWDYLKGQAFAQSERVGMVGFCFGGGVTWLMATRMPELRAAVPFYGPHPPLEDVPKINAAVLGIYGALDQRIDQGIPEIEAAMKANDKIFEKLVYPDADHAFHNDTGTRYVAAAAVDAWQQTLAWFGKYV